MEDRTLLTTFLVSTTGDSGPGSLRQAILDSNAATGGTNTIDFVIPGQGVRMIEPASPMPAITNPVLIDGFSQPGYGGTPLIELSGSQVVNVDGLTITGSDVTVRGLDINNFSQGAAIHITGTGATGDWIYGNFLGTDPTGTQAEPNNEGVEIDGGASQDLIGTNGDGVNDTAERNLLSGNLFAGVWITGQGTNGNAVAGNWIGTDITGDVALDNGTDAILPVAILPTPAGTNVGGGVVIEGGASDNRIGTDGKSVDDVGERNVIAGSGNDGIDIYGTGTKGNIVAGNFIGTDVTGTIALGIIGDGVYLFAEARVVQLDRGQPGRRHGSRQPRERDLRQRLRRRPDLRRANVNVVAGDKIGTNATGTVALGNGGREWRSMRAPATRSAGRQAGAADVISAKDFRGRRARPITWWRETSSAPTRPGPKAVGNSRAVGVDDRRSGSIRQHDRRHVMAIAGNLITDNGGPGVVVGPSLGTTSVGNEITANRIFGNTGQAIDLGDDGVTYNHSNPRRARDRTTSRTSRSYFTSPADGQTPGLAVGQHTQHDVPYRSFRQRQLRTGRRGRGRRLSRFDGGDHRRDQGQVSFDVPFSPAPAGLPIITATATDPQGNTSEVSALLPVHPSRSALSAVRVSPGPGVQESLGVLGAASGDGIALQDPRSAGPVDPEWEL